MVISKREWRILVITIAVVVALVGDKYIVTPAMAIRAQLKNDKQKVLGEISRGKSLIDRKAIMEQKWQEMISSGLENDVSKTESKVLRSLGNWSQECGFVLSSVQPERVVGEKTLREISFLVAGTGTIGSVSQFVWQVENAQLPIRIKDIQIGSRNENSDDMSLQMRLSAIFLSAETQNSETKNAKTKNE